MDVADLSFASSAQQPTPSATTAWPVAFDLPSVVSSAKQITAVNAFDSNRPGTRGPRLTMLILELKPGELLRMRTPSGEVIDVVIEDSSEHRVRFSISAPPTIHIDTEGKSEGTSKSRVAKRKKKS